MFEKKVGAVVAGLGDHGSRVDRIILKPDAVGGHIKPDDTLPGDTHTHLSTRTIERGRTKRTGCRPNPSSENREFQRWMITSSLLVRFHLLPFLRR